MFFVCFSTSLIVLFAKVFIDIYFVFILSFTFHLPKNKSDINRSLNRSENGHRLAALEQNSSTLRPWDRNLFAPFSFPFWGNCLLGASFLHNLRVQQPGIELTELQLPIFYTTPQPG